MVSPTYAKLAIFTLDVVAALVSLLGQISYTPRTMLISLDRPISKKVYAEFGRPVPQRVEPQQTTTKSDETYEVGGLLANISIRDQRHYSFLIGD